MMNPQRKPDPRWTCPKCGAIHHFDSKTGCHNRKCDYEGKLERTR